MMADNGKPDPAAAAAAVEYDPADPAKPWLHPDALTPGDYLRAKKALKEVLGDRSPYELLDGEEMYPFCIWAIRSRDDPTFTWEQALATPFYEFRLGGGPPPRTPPPASSGSKPSRTGGAGSTSKPKPPTAALSSEPSTT
jgi:hypothetical protein